MVDRVETEVLPVFGEGPASVGVVGVGTGHHVNERAKPGLPVDLLAVALRAGTEGDRPADPPCRHSQTGPVRGHPSNVSLRAAPPPAGEPDLPGVLVGAPARHHVLCDQTEGPTEVGTDEPPHAAVAVAEEDPPPRVEEPPNRYD